MIYFTVLYNAEFYHRYPDTVLMCNMGLMGLSKIGGLLALLKLGFILHAIHKS